MRVDRVSGRADLAAFVNLPFTLYKNDPNWVPPLKADVRKLLDSEHHPFYDGGREAEIELFLARDGRQVVGRIAAILNHAPQPSPRRERRLLRFFRDRQSARGGERAARGR